MSKEEDEENSELERVIGQELPFKEKTEMGEVFDNLDNDNINPKTGFSNIDFNARLMPWEVSNCMVFDELKALGILPENANITTQKKRLSVSLGGEGRKEKVQIASGSRDAELAGRSGGFLGGLKKMFSRRPDENG